MGIFAKLSDEMARQQGYKAGIAGKPVRIFLSNEEHKKAYMEGYELGRKSGTIRALHKATEKFLT